MKKLEIFNNVNIEIEEQVVSQTSKAKDLVIKIKVLTITLKITSKIVTNVTHQFRNVFLGTM